MNQASRANGFLERPFSRSDGKGLQNGYTSPSQVMPPPSAPTVYYEAAASGSSQAPSFSGTHHFNKNKVLSLFASTVGCTYYPVKTTYLILLWIKPVSYTHLDVYKRQC